MPLLAMIDYGLIVLFFLGVGCLILLVASARVQEDEEPQALPSPRQARGAYALLVLLLALFIALTVVVQRGKSSRV